MNNLIFDELQIGDKLSNRIEITGQITGYDYEIIDKDDENILVKETQFGGEYIINKHKLNNCLDLRKI